MNGGHLREGYRIHQDHKLKSRTQSVVGIDLGCRRKCQLITGSVCVCVCVCVCVSTKHFLDTLPMLKNFLVNESVCMG